jgi:iron complex outermembrane receptor protein/vitamin B12 transporter
MVISSFRRARLRRVLSHILAVLFLLAAARVCLASSIHGVVTDATGARVTGASVALVSKGQVVASGISAADGSFTISTGGSGHFFLVVTARNFRQLQTPDFYAGQFDTLERNVALEPEWVRESIVVTATGTPTPQPQTSAATTVLSPLDLELRNDLTSVLRLIPGTFVVQAGERGSQTSLFVRGGDSDDGKILLDGADAGSLGGQFDFGTLATTAVESAEVYRGPDSNLYGADADSGVVSLTTPHGTTSFPSLIFHGDAGNFYTSHEELDLSGARGRLDYLGAFSWLQTDNSLPNDEYHLSTAAANVGWSPNGSTQIRAAAHYGVDATGIPNAWDFYHVADNATEKDQNLYLSASVDNQTTASFHNDLKYGLTRKREQDTEWSPEGTCIPVGGCGGPGIAPTYSGANYFGMPVTILGANGYSASGQALLDYSWDDGSTYPSETQIVNNRDQGVYRGDLTFTQHLGALVGFQYEDERGSEPNSSFYPPVERRNYDYLAGVHGDFKNRFYYTLGGALEHYSLFGVQTTPRAGFSLFALKPRSGVFSGTRVFANFGEAVREPSLSQQDFSLYTFLAENGGQSTISALKISPLVAPESRTYEAGLEQTFLSEHIVFRASYFHNEFGKEIESVGLDLIPELLPNLTAAQQQALESTLQQDFAYELTLNSEAFRAQGVEASVESGIGKSLFFRGGYTYLDAVVQRSFTNDDEDLLGPIPNFDGIPVGPYSPLTGARPFRRAPHTGYFSATYAKQKLTGIFNAAFASRSDDSTYLEGQDAQGDNALLLPNRNLDFGYAKLDLGGSYQLFKWMDVYAMGENLLSNQHIAPIGYVSLPANVRAGVRIQWGIGSGH